jgi:hypothetical protein
VADYVANFPLNTWSDLTAIAAYRQYPGDCSLCDCIPRCQLYVSQGGNRVPLAQNPDGTYTITGQTAPGVGLYIGGAALYYSTYCCELEVVDGGSTFVYATAPVAFAMLGNCSGGGLIGYTAPRTLNDLIGECFNTLLFQSPQPFSVTVRVKECDEPQCDSDLLQWTAVPRDFTIGGPCTGSFDGTKFVGCCPGPVNTGESIRIQRNWRGTISKITVTLDGNRTRGSSTAGFFIEVNGVKVFQPAVNPGQQTVVYEPTTPITGGTVVIEHSFGSNNCADAAFVHILGVEVCS